MQLVSCSAVREYTTTECFIQDNAALDDGVNLLHHFDTSQDTFAWTRNVLLRIETRRSLLSDLLFFDILLSSGGIREPSSLYPPADVPSLRNLLRAIENSNYDILKKDCLVYFLLKFHCDGREVDFADERCIPPQFSSLSDAYWHLDTGTNVDVSLFILGIYSSDALIF
jgi:Nuclear pore complex assembly